MRRVCCCLVHDASSATPQAPPPPGRNAPSATELTAPGQALYVWPCLFVSRNFYKCWAVAMGMRGYRPTEATASDAPTDFFARHGALSTLMCVEAPCVAILCTSIEAVRSGVTIRDLCRVLSS